MRYWCEQCSKKPQFIASHRKHKIACICGSRLIPIATICDPPEPTVIEASDLAPGMVVVAVDDTEPTAAVTSGAFLCTPDARLDWVNQPRLVIARSMMPMKATDDSESVLFVARGTPC